MDSKMFKLFNKPKSLERRLYMTRGNAGGLYSAIRHTLICTRLLGLLPLSGLWSSDSNQLRFTFRTPYTFFYTLSMFGQCAMFIMAFNWLIKNGILLENITNFFYYTSNLISACILMNIAKNWLKFIIVAEKLEATLPPFRRNIPRVCNITMVLVFLADVVGYIILIYNSIKVAMSCGENDVIETYFRSKMTLVLEFTTYALWKGVLNEIFNIQSTFFWNFNDLLIMVLSIYLAEHLVVHNALLKQAVQQEHFSAMEFRIQYLNIVRLVRLVNGQVGILILSSFGSNLFWICTELFHRLKESETGPFDACYGKQLNVTDDQQPEYDVSFTYPFTFIVLRTLLVLILASRIHSNSKIPLAYLYALPSEKFDVEVERFIAQINNIKLALSGLDFFYVTRSMILTVLGTIVTYELVMLQLNKLPAVLFV